MTPCKQCSAQFEITQDDLAFLETVAPVFSKKKFPLPPPDLCPRCRMQIRIARRNERFLYHRKCDLSGKQMISCYSTNKPFPVYENDEWYSDKWSALDYGVDFDFEKTFFEQFFALQSRVPRMARILEKPYENSDYCNCASQLKNCYLIFSSNMDDDCYYGSWINQCNSCVDNLNLEKCELLYECVGCRDCYNLRYSRDCINCRDSFFLRDCQGCTHCFGCTNQIKKEYMIFNKQKTKAEHEEFLHTVNTGSHRDMTAAQLRIEEMLGDPIVKEFHGMNLENCSGDYLRNCKNAKWCFEGNNLEDCSYCQCIQNSKNCMDHTYWGQNAELVYFSQACGYDPYHVLFCNLCWHGCSELIYCDHTFGSKNCFGCSGLRKNEYCILNKQYTKEEYEKLVPKIIEHMMRTPIHLPDGSSAGCEWGKFFSPEHSIYAYNESLAQEHVALTKEEVLKRGWQWQEEEDLQKNYMGPAADLPDDIRKVDDEICTQILHCEATGKPFKVIPQELQFYRNIGIPVPRVHPDERHKRRLKLRNPRQLWERECAKCKKGIQTTYSPDRPETVYCEDCYLSAVY